MASETVQRSQAAPTAALPHPGPSGPSIDELDALWTVLERSRDAHAGDRVETQCFLASGDADLCFQVLELASVELYRRLVAAHAAERGGA